MKTYAKFQQKNLTLWKPTPVKASNFSNKYLENNRALSKFMDGIWMNNYYQIRNKLGIKFKDDIYAELCLNLWFENNWHFLNVTESGWFLESTVQKQSSKQSLSKVSLKKETVQKSTAEFWTVISNEMIKHQHPHTRFDICFINQKLNVGWFLPNKVGRSGQSTIFTH